MEIASVCNSKTLVLAAAYIHIVSLRYPYLEGLSAVLALLAASAALVE
jgi:hypothetical protein